MNAHHPRSVAARQQPGRSSDTGYTLVEIIVVVMVLGILVVISLVGSRRVLVHHDAVSGLAAISGAQEFGRLEAVKRHSQVGVLFSLEGRTVTVFEDRNRADPDAAGNGNGTPDAGEDILLRTPISRALAFSRPDGGDAIDIGGSTLLYGTDGSLRPVGVASPAVYFADAKGNRLRLRINRVTGGVTIEMRVGDGDWTARTERWRWKF